MPGTANPTEDEAAVESMIAGARQALARQEAFADLTLWDVLALGVRAPRATWRAFWATIRDEEIPSPVMGMPSTPSPEGVPSPERVLAEESLAGAPSLSGRLRQRGAVIPFGLQVVGALLALIGSVIMTSGANRTEARELQTGGPFLLAGFLLWLAAAAVAYRDDLASWRRRWWQRLSRRGAGTGDARDESSPPEHPVETLAEAAPLTDQTVPISQEARRPFSLAGTAAPHLSRLALAGLGLVLCLAAYAFNGGNTFTGFGVFVWISSIIVWLAVLTPPDFDLVAWTQARREQWARVFRREVSFRLSWTAVALIAIMLVAAYFRVADFAGVPPEMTSDHVEKLLDAQRVLDGTHQIFFPNNGGREGFQMYLVAIFSRLTGLGMQFATLKWVSVLEGLLTIPILWWMGRELIGEDQPELGNAVGLILAALVAVSYWHVALSRLALRIVLTPLIMALVMVYLARGMRHNRRADFLKAGVALGVGVYCYQAVRIIPLVIVLGVALVFLFRAKHWADRRRYLTNLAALALVAAVIFVPLGRFMIESPNLFWMRTQGRILGDDVITEADPETGQLVEREATLQDRLDALNKNLPVLGRNIRNALLMFNWKGDVAWINGAPNQPAMDVVTGSLLILGLAAWLVRMFRRRDVVDWLILPGIFIMLLPSALSIAFPVENPSATRTSGSLPLVYLIAAYGLGTLLAQLERAFRGRRARAVSVAVAVAMVWVAFGYNSSLYFGEYVARYRIAAQPYTVAGRILRGFAESDGAYGNAFMVAYPYWFDHRAVGIEGGRIDWPNGLLSIHDLPQHIRDHLSTAYAFDPDREVLFFYNRADEETPQVLRDWFPNGSSILQRTDLDVKDFYTFTAPPPGGDWLVSFLNQHPPASN